MPFYGDLDDFPLHLIIQGLSHTAKSGRLTLGTAADEITLVFDRGRVAAVLASDGRLRLGRMLVEKGYISEEVLEQALALQSVSHEPARLGELLVLLGHATPQQIKEALAALLEESLFRILVHPGGSFAFIPELPEAIPDQTVLDGTPLEPLVLNAIRRADEWLAARGRAELIELVETLPDPAVLDQLRPNERTVLLALINGATTLHDLLAETGQSLNGLDRTIAQLVALGLVQVREAQPADPRASDG
ncbi:DUF4388 domain-containing protein [Thermorudis peleae]|uniref:DUF4388 domain-containing protein n=1 Tax=Thermorudis peleae TaxID=1382356 RepID=UPI00056FA0C9|nr:DUF4388 domain-containing protein [Thermorudis peleae]